MLHETQDIALYTITGGSMAVLAFESTPCTTPLPLFAVAFSDIVELDRSLFSVE